MNDTFREYAFELAHPKPPTTDEIMANINRMLEETRHLPPLPEYIAIHPDDSIAFKSLFPAAPEKPYGHWMGRPLTSVPIRLDDSVRRDTVRVRVEGEDRDMPFVMPRYLPAPEDPR